MAGGDERRRPDLGPVRSRGRGPELGALAAALLVAAVLLGLAASPLVDPERAGEAAVARRARVAAADVEDAWRDVLRGEAWLAGAGEVLAWSPAELARSAARARPEPLQLAEASAPPAFRALLAESEARELQGDLPEALAAAHDALAVVASDGTAPARDRQELEADDALGADDLRGARAEALVRIAQLAAKSGDVAATRAAWNALRTELTGAELRGDLPLLALGALAVAPALPPDEREPVRAEVVRRWLSGELALPTPAPRALDTGPAATALPEPTATLIERIQSLAPARDPRLDREATGLRLHPLLADHRFHASPAVGAPDPTAASPPESSAALPRGTPPESSATASRETPPESNAVRLLDHGEHVFVLRTGRDGARGGWTTRAALRERLLGALAEVGLPGDGIAVDLAGGAAALGAALGPWNELGAGVLGFQLRHPDPAELGAETGAPVRLVRAGLGLLAALAAVAGAALFGALRRDRRLQELKARFVASVSHELRTPLASILLLAENLEHGRVAASSRTVYHRSIRREAQRLRRLVDDVLDFSRLERGEPPRLSREDTALAPLVAAVVDEARDRAEHAGAELAVHAAAVSGSAVLDADAVRRAVLNLVDNALRHAGGADLRLDVAAGDRLVFAVSDRGPGVPPEQRERVFEPFAQLGAGSRATAGGAGLGLAIVRTIARQHGGDATVRAREPAPGAVFELWLPLAPAAPANPVGGEVRPGQDSGAAQGSGPGRSSGPGQGSGPATAAADERAGGAGVPDARVERGTA